VDPTRAGDVFAATFLVEYCRSGESRRRQRVAGCAASFCVEAQGTAGISPLAQVEEKLGNSKRRA